MKTAVLALTIFLAVYLVTGLFAWLMHRRTTAALRLADFEAEVGRRDPSVAPGYVPYSKREIRLGVASLFLNSGFLFGGAALLAREGNWHAVGLGLALVGVSMMWMRVFVRTRIKRMRIQALQKQTREADAG